MDNLEDIAEKKIEKGLDRILNKLDRDYEAMLRRHSADGLLRSGNTIKSTMDYTAEAAESLRDLMIEQFQWVIEESVVVTKVTIDTLEDIAQHYFERVYSAGEEFLDKSTEIANSPKLFQRMLPEVEASIDAAYEDVKIEIEASSAANLNRGAKGIAKTLLGWLSKLWGG